MKIKFLLLLYFAWGLGITANAQRHNENWYFGNKAAISFSGAASSPVVKSDNPMLARASASVSDSVTGQLLFYTNGENVWNRNHTIMPNGVALVAQPNASSTLIVPNPVDKNQYYLFTIENTAPKSIYYSIIDMTLNGGLGDVTDKTKLLTTNVSTVVTAVKHLFNNSYWLITHSDNTTDFLAYEISASGIKNPPIVSNAGEAAPRFADLVSNNDGTKLALTKYSGTDAIVQVFDFDKYCGRVLNAKTLYKDPVWDYAYGAAFSPDDSKLYIVYGYIESQLVQYRGGDFSNWEVVVTSNQNFNDILMGPDGRLYISTHDANVPSRIVDVLNYPNNTALATGYSQDVLDLGAGRDGNFEFPNIITDKSTPKPGSSTHGLSIKHTNSCIGDSTRFSISGNAYTPDSVKWVFLDPNSADSTSTLLNPAHLYTQPGEYWVFLNYYRCGLEILMAQRIKIIEAANISLGPDTGFCHNSSITLTAGATGLKHQWSTGDTTETITVNKGGLYWVNITSANCKAEDSITIREFPSILVEIGEKYTICDDNNDLIRLDAGKGFDHYKWTPTGDTTQWIIVKKAGDYYVVVEDFRGCKGNDGAQVLRLCDFDFHIPNSFTPNGDGRNDVFKPTASDVTDYKIEIYTLWGEKLFETEDPTQGWTGTYKGEASPIGTYIWKLSFKGFHNKLLRNYNHNGVVNLIR